MRMSVAATVACLIAGITMAAESSAAIKKYELDIPRQSLDTALKDLAHQTGLQIARFSDTIDGSAVVGPVSGSLTPQQALENLLSVQRLSYKVVNDRTIAIVKPDAQSGRSSGITAAPKANGSAGSSLLQLAHAAAQPREGFWGRLRLAQVAGGSSSGTVSNGPGNTVEEVIVTANKRSERIQDIAASLTAVSREEIERRGLLGMDDYLRGVAGVNNIDRGVAMNSIVIRGVTADAQNYTDMGGTVGLYLGDVPLAGYATYGSSVDIKLVDMERVEVLRGPQGTLYGDGSLGGTVRNIIRAPDLHALEGQVKVSYGYTAQEGSGNDEQQAVLNLPIIDDELAVRVVGYRYENSGYVENIAVSDPAYSQRATAQGFGHLLRDEQDVGDSNFVGGRVTALWRPTAKFSAQLMLLRQDLEQNGLPEVQLGLGTYQQTRLLIDERYGGGGERIRDDVSIASLELEYDLGWGRLRSSTSYIDEQGYYLRDLSSERGGRAYPQHVETDATGFVEEVRFASQFDGPLQLLTGVYYNDSVRDRFSESHEFLTPNTVVRRDGRQREASSKQVAVFGEVSYQVLSQRKATVGARAFEYDQEFVTLSYLPAVPTTTILESRDRGGETYKFNLTWTPAANALVYAQWAEGFRLGAPLSGPPPSTCDIDNDGLIDGTNLSAADRQLVPDSLESYELGTKLTLAEGRGTVGVSIYHNDWTGIPVIVPVPCGFGQFQNAGKAQTEGVEFESSWALAQGWKMNLSASYVDAELVSNSPGVGSKGDRLPGSPRYNVSTGLQYEFDFSGVRSFARADVLKTGGFYNNLAGIGQEIGDYTTVNLRSGVTLGAVNVEAYVNNATNSDALTWIDSVFVRADGRASRLRPRTIGLSLGYRF